MRRIAVAMIVKNEEAHIERCLKSVKELGDIYIVDTGSTDKTCEIARKYTDKVFENEYKWNDNFAEARNYVLDKADADWILSIDADEYLEETSLDMIYTEIQRAEYGNFSTVNVWLKSEGKDGIHKFPRLFKKDKCRWKGAIHNYLTVSENNDSNIFIVYGYSEAHKKDPDRSLRILTKVVNDKPDCAREKYYLAREYWYRGQMTAALQWYTEYLKKAWWAPEMADAYVMMARCYIKMNQYKNARVALLNAININPDYKEALHLMGELTGPNNSAIWQRWAYQATNKSVLFVNDLRSARDKQLERCIPDVYNYKSVLYIGAHEGRCSMLKDFRNHEYMIDILEPNETNYKYCKGLPGIQEVYRYSLQRFETFRKYDIVFWWHGPEHIDNAEVEQTFKRLDELASKYIILGCPWGKYEQGALGGNVYEIHKKHWTIKEFEDLGYQTNTLGQENIAGSNLLAWKKMSKEKTNG